MADTEKVPVPEDVIEQLEAIRETTPYNMFDKAGVQKFASECDFHAAVVFIEECDKETWGSLILNGPIAEKKEKISEILGGVS